MDRTKQRLFEVMSKIDSSFKQKLNEDNIYQSKYGHTTLDKPIISDAIKILSENPKAIKFNNKQEFEQVLNNQKYFSASYSHAFQTIEDYNNRNSDEQSILLFETGHEIVGVWDDINSIGFILPK
jgi:hypothetical protein